MKRTKKFMAMALACALSLSLAVPAFAADDNGDGYDDTTGAYLGGQTVISPSVEGGTQEIYKTDNGRSVPFIGVIKPTQIKATIPTQVVFDLDPTIDYSTVDSEWYAQVTNPENLKIVNDSTVPMYAYVKDVTTYVDDTETAVTLGNTPTVLDTARGVMFGLTSTAKAEDGSQKLAGSVDHWMVPKGGADADKNNVLITGDKVYMLNKLNGTGDGTNTSLYTAIAPSDGAANGDDELALWVNCVSVNGWAADDVFTVMPTIIVAAKDPDITVTYKANAVTDGTDPVNPDSTVATPKFSVAGGEVAANTTVTLSCDTAGAKIYYTTDGSTPTSSSSEYTGAITIDVAKTIKAIAIKAGMTNSGVATAVYTIASAP